MLIPEILESLIIIVRRVLDNEGIIMSVNTTAKDVGGWDSLTHILIVVAIEKRFGIRFASGEIYNFKDVGEICSAVQIKLGK